MPWGGDRKRSVWRSELLPLALSRPIWAQVRQGRNRYTCGIFSTTRAAAPLVFVSPLPYTSRRRHIEIGLHKLVYAFSAAEGMKTRYQRLAYLTGATEPRRHKSLFVMDPRSQGGLQGSGQVGMGEFSIGKKTHNAHRVVTGLSRWVRASRCL